MVSPRLALPLFIVLLAAAPLRAEERRAEETFIPNYSVAGASFTGIGDTDFEGGDGSLSMREAETSANLPLFLGDDLRVTAGLDYRWNRFEFSGAPDPLGSSSLDLHRVSLPLNLWADLNDRWKLWVRLQPGLYSDFGTVDSDDFILSSLGLLSYKWSDSLTLAFGGFYSRDLGEERILPAIGAIFRSDPHWSLAVTFPRLELAYAPSPDWLFTSRAVLHGSGWNITNPAGGPDIDLYHQTIRAGVGVEHRIAGPWWIHGDAGIQFAQEIEVQGSGYDFTEDLDPSAFFSVGVKLRF